jgi:hypothetical protein
MRTRLRISGYISDLLGLSLFSSDFKVFTASYALLLIGTTFSSLFISTFLFQINRNITTLAIYHIVYYACEAAVFYIALRLSHIISSVRYIIAGFVLYAAGYSLLLLLRDKSVYFYPLVAVVISTGSGLYFTAHFNCFQLYSNSENRFPAITLHGFFANIIALTVPMVSGFVIVKAPGMTGYMVIFGLSLVFFILAILNIRRLKKEEKSESKLAVTPFFRDAENIRAAVSVMAGQFLLGLRQGIYTYYFNILIFSLTSNEFILGVKNMLAGLSSIAAFYIIGKLNLSHRGRLVLMFTGAVLSIIFTSSLLVWTTSVAVIAYCVFDAVALIMLNVPADFINYESALGMSRKRDTRAEYTAVRLITLDAGRIIGIFVSLLIPADTRSVIIFFITLSGTNLIASLVYGKAQRMSEKSTPEVEHD